MRLNVKGPEPIVSTFAFVAGVAAIRAGIITGSIALGFPKASITKANGRDNTIWKLRSSTTRNSAVAAIILLPKASIWAHRFMEAMQSSGVTGAPSCHVRPGRNVIVQIMRSSLDFHDSSI